ncbi:uncharacterized protein [Anoplolepis gracilipes]|uniref:uncharacterized protein n=1 Tax=Anoplolepis gracilipes TaxID=354296 RepID=UPI003BA1A410
MKVHFLTISCYKMWTILDFYSLKILWIFTFVELCIMAFLILLNNTEIMEMKKRILYTKVVSTVSLKLQRSRNEIKNIENVLPDVENKSLFCRDRYKSIIAGLKKDVRKTEVEMKMLQDHISRLSFRREELKYEILKDNTIESADCNLKNTWKVQRKIRERERDMCSSTGI